MILHCINSMFTLRLLLLFLTLAKLMDSVKVSGICTLVECLCQSLAGSPAELHCDKSQSSA